MNNVHSLTGYESDCGAGGAAGRALRELNSVSAFDTSLEEMAGMLTDIDGLLNDFNRTVSDYLSDLEFDQNLFLQIEERLNIINRLKDKYGSTIEEIFQYQQQKQEEMERLLDADAYREKLEKELKLARAGLESCAQGPRKSGKTRARSCLPC